MKNVSWCKPSFGVACAFGTLLVSSTYPQRPHFVSKSEKYFSVEMLTRSALRATGEKDIHKIRYAPNGGFTFNAPK
jgi:hypothetical protein